MHKKRLLLLTLKLISTIAVISVFATTISACSVSDISNGKYNIISSESGMYLNVFANPGQAKNGTNISVSKPDGTNEQLFEIESLDNHKYLIWSCSTEDLQYCVDVYTPNNKASDVKNDTNVQIWENSKWDDEVNSKHWYFDKLGNGDFVIRSVLNKTLVLTAENSDHRANVVVQTYLDGNALQIWKLQKSKS